MGSLFPLTPGPPVRETNLMQDSEIDTILGDDIVFRGKLQFKTSLKINGNFKGTVSSAGHLVIGPGAKVEADVEAGYISIEGTLRGNILAKHRIDIIKNARMQGDMKTPELQIQPGSRFTGNCIMD